jgi:inorganic pyrophosphatase
MAQLFCRVETPKGAVLTTPRRLDERAVVCPADCCYFPDTRVRSGRPLQAIVCRSQPGSPGDRVAVKPIALLRSRREPGDEAVVVCVPVTDPIWGVMTRVDDLPARLRRDIEWFLSIRSAPDLADTMTWCSRDDARAAIDDAAARWAAIVNGRG